MRKSRRERQKPLLSILDIVDAPLLPNPDMGLLIACEWSCVHWSKIWREHDIRTIILAGCGASVTNT
jgi:hypothetical protein